MDKGITWMIFGLALMMFGFGVKVGATIERMKDTPHVMHPQEVTHGQ